MLKRHITETTSYLCVLMNQVRLILNIFVILLVMNGVLKVLLSGQFQGFIFSLKYTIANNNKYNEVVNSIFMET